MYEKKNCAEGHRDRKKNRKKSWFVGGKLLENEEKISSEGMLSEQRSGTDSSVCTLCRHIMQNTILHGSLISNPSFTPVAHAVYPR